MHPILTRRRALTILALVCGGYVGKRADAQQTTVGSSNKWQPGALAFHLDAFKEYRFILGAKTIIVTPEELMKALKDD